VRANALAGWSIKRLRVALLLFFLALTMPTAILIKQAYSQLKWEAYHQQRVLAEELVSRIDRRYYDMIEIESARSFTDYSFLNIAGDLKANIVQRSPLSQYPPKSAIPGVIGYFQIDNKGQYSTPILPVSDSSGKASGIPRKELKQRLALSKQIYQVLTKNHLVQKQKIEIRKQDIVVRSKESDADGLVFMEIIPDDEQTVSPVEQEQGEGLAQEAFDKLQSYDSRSSLSSSSPPQGLGRVEDLKLKKGYQQKLSESQRSARAELPEKKIAKRKLRKESNILPSGKLGSTNNNTPARKQRPAAPVSMFESEIDAFEFSVLDSGHFVLYRKVWRDGQRYIQGLLLESGAFIDGVIKQAFYETALSKTSSLLVAYQGSVLAALGGGERKGYLSKTEELQGSLLLQDHLSTPLGRMELIFSVNALPAGPGGTIIIWTSVILSIVFMGGFAMMYRLGVRQLILARQQQDFVSAVSHELKTPLTSIRMYGEMLREGWTTEEKRKTYYDFIHDESERLTRLINNVLQLARMTRNDLKVELKPCPAAQLMDTIQSKIGSQIERAGFVLNIDSDEQALAAVIEVDADYFIQIVINLVDNGIKFSTKSERRKIDIRCKRLRDDKLQFSIRDYGPGVPKDQMRKIFHLFYRSENELTRETVGTGIGLALVHQLTLAMYGHIDVVNRDPGAEFQISFPLVKTP